MDNIVLEPRAPVDEANAQLLMGAAAAIRARRQNALNAARPARAEHNVERFKYCKRGG